MIVWLASYPRSGNTFSRIVLNAVWDLPTYTTYQTADALTYDKGAGNLTGNRPLSDLWPEGKPPTDWHGFLAELDSREEVYFIKTHLGPNGLGPHRRDKTILLVRHGLDAYVSFANYYVNVIYTLPRLLKTWRGFRWFPFRLGGLRWLFRETGNAVVCACARLLRLRERAVKHYLKKEMNLGSWEKFHHDWLNVGNENLVVVRFDQLIADPVVAMNSAIKKLGLDLQPKGGEVPTFETLKKVHPTFFRKGKSGTFKTECPKALQNQFLNNAKELMGRLGFTH